MVAEQCLLKLYFLPLIGTFQSCQLSCRIRNLTLQQSVFRFQAVQMTCLQGGISSAQESITKQVKMPMYRGCHPNTMPQPVRHIYWKGVVGEDEQKTCSLFESVQERCYRLFTTFMRLQLDYMWFHVTDWSSIRPQFILRQCSEPLAQEIIKDPILSYLHLWMHYKWHRLILANLNS